MNTQHSIHFLWLLPEAVSSARLRRLIEDLSTRVGAAPFEPHVTLLGRLCAEPADLIERTRELAERIGPLRIAVERAGHSDAYFRCVYFTAALDGELSAARAEAEQTFGCAPSPTPFFPHLSLVYGALDPATRQQLADAAHRVQWAQFGVDRLQLVESAPDYRDWQTIGTFALGSA
jgi:2'-5' RNA ligase